MLCISEREVKASLSTPSLIPFLRLKDQEEIGFFPFFPHFIPINLSLLSGPRRTTCPLWSWVRFCHKTINLFSIQFILNELSSSHFLTSDIFVKILSLESLATRHPENRKNSDCLRIRRNFYGSLDFTR